MTLVFKEPETFKTPDGEEYVILPVQVDDMPLFFKIANKRTELYQNELKEAKKKAKKAKKELDEDKVDIPIEIFLKECGEDLTILIDKTVLNIKNGEPVPLKYRNPGNVLHWMFSIMAITTPDRTKPDSDGDDTPLKQAKKSSGKSSQAKPT